MVGALSRTNNLKEISKSEQNWIFDEGFSEAVRAILAKSGIFEWVWRAQMGPWSLALVDFYYTHGVQQHTKRASRLVTAKVVRSPPQFPY